MDPEFSMQKQDFTIIKEKIIKTNEILLLYNEKTETLNKAKNAFKQLKSKYEAATNETSRLKIDNERLNYSLEMLKPKYEQCEKDLIEVRTDYKRTEERYQQNMIELQLSISKFEEKVKQCTCEKDLLLSPSKKRNSNTEKIKDLKEKCKELKEVETNLKNENNHFKLKNKELETEKLKNVKVLEDFTTKNVILQRDLTAVKNKVQIMELASKGQANLQLTITSLKQKHEKEIDSLRMEIAKLSFDNQRIKYLELECKNLKEQINRQELQKIRKADSCVQTEIVSANDSLNVEKINMLERKCKELEENLTNLKNNGISKSVFGKAKVIDPMQTLTVWDDDSSDFDDSVSDILSEMILPKALSPMSFSSRTTESPTPPLISLLEPLSLLDENLSLKEPVPIPNIVITPPTPGVEIAGLSHMVFPVLTDNSETAVADIVLTKETKKENKRNIKDINEIQQSSNNQKRVTAKYSETAVEEEILFKHPGHIEKYGLLEHKATTPINKHELLDNTKFSKENKPSSKTVNSIVTGEDEMPTNENLLEEASLSRYTDNGAIHTSLLPTSKKSVSTETESGCLKTQWNSTSKTSRNLQKDFLNLKDTLQGRRKFWIPYNMNSFVKMRKKRRQIKRTKVTNNYREMSNQPPQKDTILNALRTLQQNNINFTISNESIPLVQPYNCYSLPTPPKAEPKSITRKVANTFSYSLNCWNQQCTVHNTQMLLRKVRNDEEEELLGFFSVKDEIITPAVSRMAVSDQPNALNAEDLVSQLLSGIKELVAVKRKETSGIRRKKRAKSMNRWSDFHSETETELEKLFRTSADVLGRNRRFLAAAKEQSFQSNEESMFESGSDAMVDSGLVTGTPQDDSDCLSFCSQNELGEGLVSDVFSSTVRTGENSASDVVLSNHNENAFAPLKDDENFAGFPSPNAFSCVSKFAAIFSNESPLGNSAIPKFTVCPDMISPIASSKGSPETFKVSSTPIKTPVISHPASSDCFKLPFCPSMISPMASSKGSPVSQTSKAIQNTYEDSLDSFRIPLAPPLISPLALFPKAKKGDQSETIDSSIKTDDMSIKESVNSANIRLSKISDNADISKLSNIDLQSLNGVNFSEILSKTEYNNAIQDGHHNKPSSSGIKKSSVCQRITFDSVTDNEHFGQAVDPVSMDVGNVQESVSKRLLTYVDDNQKTFDKPDISKDDHVLCVNSTIQGTGNEDLADAVTNLQSEVNRPIQVKDIKLDSLVLDESSFHIDLSVKSSELNVTLDNISISQLDFSCATNNVLGKPNEVHLNASQLKERHCPYPKEICKLDKNNDPIETGKSSCPERRYPLRGKSQSNVQKDLRFESENNDSPATECSMDFSSPRSRAAKRKLEDEVENKDSQIIRTTRLSKLTKREDLVGYSEEIMSKDVLGTDSESAGDISTKCEEFVGPLVRKRGRPRKVDKLAVFHNKNNSDSLLNLPTGIPGQRNAGIIEKEDNSNVEEIIRNNVLGTDSDNVDDILTKREELVVPLLKKRGRPRKVDKLAMLQNKKDSASQINLPAKILGQQNAKSEIIQKEDNIEEDPEKVCDTKNKEQQQTVKKSLKSRRTRSANSNKDMSIDFFDWELDGATDTNLKRSIESCEQATLKQVRRNSERSTTEAVSTDGLDSGMETECLKGRRTGCKPRDIISKEFISESESDSDISLNVHAATNHEASKRIQEKISDSEQGQSSSNTVTIVNTNILEKTNLSTSNKTTEREFDNAEDKTRKIEIPSRSDSETKSYNNRQNNCSSNKAITLEIQDILRNLSDKPGQTCNFLQNDLTTVSSNALAPSVRDLFGDSSESEDETINDDINISAKLNPKQRPDKPGQTSNFLQNDMTTVSSNALASSVRDLFGDSSESKDETINDDSKISAKLKLKKRPAKQSLRKKMSNQVKGLIYATGQHKDREIVKKNFEDKPVEIPNRSNVPEDTCANSLPGKEKEFTRIKIVQNILISKGRAFNLLPSNGIVDPPSSAALSLNATKPIRPSPSKVNQVELSRPYQRKKRKLEQNVSSSSSSTPVDILSQVMQGMVKTGPKTARKKTFNQTSYLSSAAQSRLSGFNNNVGIRTSEAPKKIVHENVGQPCKMEKPLTEERTAAVVRSVDESLDCPRSPDVMEVPDRLPRLIPTELPAKLQGSKVRALIDKLMIFSNEAKMLDDVIQEFAFQDMTFIVEVIIDKLSQDYRDKADNSFPPSPPMTSTQRILLGFLLKLNRSTHPGIEERFLSLAERQLFNRNLSKLENIEPITRLYTALCKLRYDLNRIRRFICEGFFFMSDLAVPMLFTLLTMWGEVLPMMESERSDDLLAKVIVQICYLKDCNRPGYNLMPLRDLLRKYYGYPAERWQCNDLFKEIMIEYIRNPSIRLSDFTLLLFLKNKPTGWVYQQVKETIIPLYNQARDTNPNLKATLVILLANICCAFNQVEQYDWSVILEMDRWFLELDRDDLDPIIKRSIHLARGRLPRRVRIRKKNKTVAENPKTDANKPDNQDNVAELTENGASNLPLEETTQENDCDDSLRTDVSRVTGSLMEENSESTKTSVNIDLRWEHSSHSDGEDKIQNADNSLLNEEENAVSSSDIEF